MGVSRRDRERAKIMRVARPRWMPKTDEQRDAVAAATRAAKRLEADELVLWKAIESARALRVPMTYLAEVVGRGRATLYRRAPQGAAPIADLEPGAKLPKRPDPPPGPAPTDAAPRTAEGESDE